MQVDPMKPKLKAPGTKRLKLHCHVLLSTFAFRFNLRRYIEDRNGAKGTTPFETFWYVDMVGLADHHEIRGRVGRSHTFLLY